MNGVIGKGMLGFEDWSVALLDIEDHMTRRFPAWLEVGDRALCPTGEPYVVLACGGIKEEGAACSVWTNDFGKAVELFKSEYDKLTATLVGELYWRRRPEIMIEHTHLGSLCTITARFAISDKPRLPSPKECQK